MNELASNRRNHNITNHNSLRSDIIMSREVAYEQPSAAPVPKVASAGIAGTVVTILIYGANTFLNIEITAEVAAALVTLISFVAGYLKKDTKPPAAIPAILESKYTDSLKG